MISLIYILEHCDMFIFFYYVQYFSTNGKQTIKFLDKDLEFLAGSGDAQGMDFYDVKDVVVNYQCAGSLQFT